MLLPPGKLLTTPLSNFLVEGGLVKSKGEPTHVRLECLNLTTYSGQADTLAKQGGLQLNGSKEDNPRRVLRAGDFINGEVAVVRKGNEHLVLALEKQE